jgi:hypothetical protein
MGINTPKPANTYQIKVKENLEPSASDWFGSVTITPLEDGGTLLVGTFSDQPALRGFLDQLWNLNFTILAVERIDDERLESERIDDERLES